MTSSRGGIDATTAGERGATRLTDLTIVRAEGDPTTRGQIIGLELRDEINESVDFYHRYFARRGVSSEQLQELLTPYLVASEARFPALMGVLKGMSVGAMIPVLELFAINAFEELEPMLEAPEGEMLFLQRKEGYVKPPPTERCSSFSVIGPDVTLVAHNEHWLAGDRENVAIIVDVPDDGGVPVMSPSVVCCLPAVGINGLGTAQGIGSLTANDDGPGIPRVLVSRNSLEAMDRDDALARAELAGRAGGYGHVFAFADGTGTVVETTAKRAAVLDDARVHTNHYLSEQLTPIGAEPSEGSRARHDRLVELLEERRPASVEGAMDILRDHGSTPQAVCLHPDPDEGEEASAVMFSMVADVRARTLWVARGNPCENEYVEIDASRL
jgi:isopenicillin-N N-acyltransferase like protein